jgi:hypothetical protein
VNEIILYNVVGLIQTLETLRRKDGSFPKNEISLKIEASTLG